jgi:hypothetical protein
MCSRRRRARRSPRGASAPSEEGRAGSLRASFARPLPGSWRGRAGAPAGSAPPSGDGRGRSPVASGGLASRPWRGRARLPQWGPPEGWARGPRAPSGGERSGSRLGRIRSLRGRALPPSEAWAMSLLASSRRPLPGSRREGARLPRGGLSEGRARGSRARFGGSPPMRSGRRKVRSPRGAAAPSDEGRAGSLPASFRGPRPGSRRGRAGSPASAAPPSIEGRPRSPRAWLSGWASRYRRVGARSAQGAAPEGRARGLRAPFGGPPLAWGHGPIQ